MTRTGRNNTVLMMAVSVFLAALVTIVLFTFNLGEIDPQPGQWRAIAGALATTVIAFTVAVLYMRLFHRSPSVPVFFMVLFFIFSALDISKLGQVMVSATAWRHFSPLLARVSIFGHVTGALALFAAGLYASVARMQRHGTAMTMGLVIALGLSWAVPIDTFRIRENLVYSAGFHPSLDAMILVVLVLAVLNFIHAALVVRERRQLMSAGAVALIVLGRETLFYRTEPLLIALGAALLVTGAAVFAVENYRDYLVG